MKLRGDRIAIVGDLHGKWNTLDNEFFDSSEYDFLLFVGDLGSGSRGNGLAVIRQIARLRVPALVMPGNNDAEHMPFLQAELSHQAGKLDLLRALNVSVRQGVEPCGYSSHLLETNFGAVTLIAGRPCAMGGSAFSFAERLQRVHGIADLAASARRMRELIDETSTESLLFVAHNGPYGLGGEACDLWGRDFDLPGDAPDDWGDSDLAQAIDYAKERGKRVLAVIAGHMHRSPRRETRPLALRRDGTLYVNAAVVPRIRSGETGQLHHHAELRLLSSESDGAICAEVQEHWVEAEGEY